MGPLLFLIYVNDMPDLALNSKFMLYADDTVWSGLDFFSIFI